MRLITIATAFLLPSIAVAQAPMFTPERMRAHVEFLADDLLEGRETGTRGYDLAARYVATQLAAYGLKPGGANGGWYQQVTLQKTVRVPGGASITLTGPGGEKRYAHADNVLVGLNSREAKIDIEAPLLFAGYGIEDKRLGLDDYRGLDVKGKIVVVLRGFPKGMPSEEGAHLNATKGEAAQRHGAIGMIAIATLLSQKVFPWQRSLEYANDPDYAWVGEDGKAFELAPGIRARALFNGPAAEALFAGSGRNLGAILAQADRDKGVPRGFALRTRVRVQSESTWERVTSPNVVGILPGADPALAAQHVVLSAHLDHLGIRDRPGADAKADRIHNGALDNAAGIATMLEVARAAAAAPDRPRRSILFLATTAEEKGLLGADYFARHPTVPIASIVGNVGLDMPLLLYPFSDLIAFGANHSSFGRLVAEAVAPLNLKLSPDPMPEQGVFTRSDHYEFVKQGVPAVYLVTGFASGGGENYGKFLSGNYHSPHDDLSQPIDWASGARFAEANYRVTRAMADVDLPPMWIEGDYFGDVFAPKASRAKR